MRSSLALDATPLRRAGPRWRAWAWAGAAALALHAWLLADGTRAGGLRQVQVAEDALRVLAVRRIPAPAARVANNAGKAHPSDIVQPGSPPVVHGPGPAPRPQAVALTRVPAATVSPAPATAEPAAPPTGDEAPTTYATRLPPSFALAFELQRGTATGQGELRFELGSDGYALTLQTRLAGREALGLSSRGKIDAHGLAPDRHATLRRGRERLAAHFDHDAQRITYSGPQVVNELQPGAQDRLSWMVQLPAIVDADPAAFGAGARIRVPVNGARGDSATWVFVVLGVDEGLLHLVREPLRPYDTRAEIWLDPASNHLPARVRLQHAPAADALELRRAPAATPANGAS